MLSLRHRYAAEAPCALINVARSMRDANAQSALADRGEHGVAVATVKIAGALVGVPEEARRIRVFPRDGQACAEAQADDSDEEKFA